MKKTLKLTSLLMAVLMLTTVFCTALVSCTPQDSPNAETTTDGNQTTTTPPSGDNPSTGGNLTYSVHINTVGGMDLSGITVKIHTEENGYIVTDPIATDSTGTAVFTLPRSDQYYVALTTVPEGYSYEARYDFDGSVCEITLRSSVIEEAVEYEDGMYKLGSVMHDFEYTDIDGNTYVLSEILEEKKCVLLNFWYTTCTYCIQEFPLLDAAYLAYFDDVEVLALDNYGDSKSEIKSFREQHDLNLPMIYDTTDLMYAFDYSAFDAIGYPISVVIDRYGVVCMIEVGAILDDAGFEKIFKHFTAANYQQKIFTDPSELMPTEKPDVEMPSSEELNAVLNTSGSLPALYAPETTEGVAEYCWPFIITEKDGEACIAPSNSKKNYTYAALHATVNLKAGEAVAFDYYTSTESGADLLYTRINDVNMYQISGIVEEWKTCYTFVADTDGEYRLTFWYLKDSTTHEGDDAVYIKNLRVVPHTEVNIETYIPRFCATNPTESMDDYLNYSEIFFNETDGYYHVGKIDGPLLLADMLNPTLFMNGEYSVYEYVQLGRFEQDASERLTQYANYASNATVNGLCTVNQELKELLEMVANTVGYSNSPDAWLQICKYYDAYPDGIVSFADPIQGLANHSAIEALEGVDNVVEYDGRILMPRGLRYRFTPTRSGVYEILSNSDSAVEAWLFTDESTTPAFEYEHLERTYEDTLNCKMIVYLEEGKNYYISIAYYDLYKAGEFTFTVTYLGETYQNFCYGSGAAFTSSDENDMSEYNLIAGGINVALGEDGFYHQLYADGTLNPTILYADFTDYTPVFNQTLEKMIEMGGFDFTYSESDVFILSLIKEHGKGEEFQAALREEWGNGTFEDENGNVISLFDSYYEEYKVDEVLAGIYHGKGGDKTEWVRAYMLEHIILDNAENPELNGCVPLTEELAEVLQLLMDKYTFNVEKSWTKVCCYYQQFGPNVPAAK